MEEMIVIDSDFDRLNRKNEGEMVGVFFLISEL